MSLNKSETIKRLQIRSTASGMTHRFCGKMPKKTGGVVVRKFRKSKEGCKVLSSLTDGALSVITFGNLPGKTIVRPLMPKHIVYVGPEADEAKIRGDFAQFDIAIADGISHVCRKFIAGR